MKTLKNVLSQSEYSKSSKYAKNAYYPRKKKTDNTDIFDFLELMNQWEKVVGPKLSEKTIPLQFQNRTLTILCSHPVFAQQLKYMEQVIIKKIGDVFLQLQGSITRITFKADNQHFLKKKAEATKKEAKKDEFKKKWHKHSPEYKQAMQDADKLLSDINDEDLKQSLQNIYLQIQERK